jgi:multiple sugar transport system substrate-binding protein
MQAPKSVHDDERHTLSRREFLKLAGAGAGMLALAGCGPKSTPVVTEAPAVPEQVNLSLLVDESGEGLTIVKGIVEAFNDKQPDILVDVSIPSGGDYYTVLQTQVAAGSPPDMMQMGEAYMPPWAEKGAFIPLDDYLKGDPEGKPDDFYPAVLQVFQWKDKTYALPKDMVTWALYYNKTLFDQAGLDYPGDWTEEDYLEAAQKLTIKDDNGRIVQYGDLISTSWGNYFPMIWQHGGRYLDDEHTKCFLNEPAAYEALQWWADLINVYETGPTPVQAQQAGLGFETGKVAMLIQGTYMVPGFQQVTGFEWDIAQKPKGPDGRWSIIYSGAFGISPKCKWSDQAWEFVKFMTYEGSEMLAALGYSMPSRKSVATKPGVYVGAENTKGKNVQVFVDASEFARLHELTPTWGQEEQIIKADLDLVWLGQKTAKEATANIVPQIDALLASGG